MGRTASGQAQTKPHQGIRPLGAGALCGGTSRWTVLLGGGMEWEERLHRRGPGGTLQEGQGVRVRPGPKRQLLVLALQRRPIHCLAQRRRL